MQKKRLSSLFAIGLILVFAAILAAPFGASAQIVTCGLKGSGKICNVCDIFGTVQNILNFAWNNLAIPLAAIMFIYAGFLMMIPGIGGEKSAGQYTKGKKVLTNTVVGLAIAFFAWIGVDTVIKILGADPQKFGPWNEIACTAQEIAAVRIPDITGGGIDQGGLLNGLTPYGPGPDLNTSRDATPVNTQFVPTQVRAYTDTIAAAINQFGNKVDVAFVQGVIMAESSARADVTSTDGDGKTNYGLMQVRVDTARGLDPEGTRGLSDAEIGEKLKGSTYNITLGTKLLSQLANKYGSPEAAWIAYNVRNPSDALGNSTRCPGLKSWECDQNPGYAPTRRGVATIRDFVQRLRG